MDFVSIVFVKSTERETKLRSECRYEVSFDLFIARDGFYLMSSDININILISILIYLFLFFDII